MSYHLFKQSRVYQGQPYCGPTSNNIPAKFETIEQAEQAQELFTKSNPVGWNIFEAETGKLINGHDFFEEEPTDCILHGSVGVGGDCPRC